MQVGFASASNYKFGFFPRIDFDLGQLTFEMEYDIIPASKAGFEISANALFKPNQAIVILVLN